MKTDLREQVRLALNDDTVYPVEGRNITLRNFLGMKGMKKPERSRTAGEAAAIRPISNRT